MTTKRRRVTRRGKVLGAIAATALMGGAGALLVHRLRSRQYAPHMEPFEDLPSGGPVNAWLRDFDPTHPMA